MEEVLHRHSTRLSRAVRILNSVDQAKVEEEDNLQPKDLAFPTSTAKEKLLSRLSPSSQRIFRSASLE